MEIHLKICSALTDDIFGMEFITDNDICTTVNEGWCKDTWKHLRCDSVQLKYCNLFINS